METVYLDTETTGVSDDDEMVELTIIDDNCKPLINTLIKPKYQPMLGEHLPIHIQ